MILTAYFAEGGTPKTGLSPTINIYDLTDNSLVVSAVVMTEVAEGFYKYDFTTYSSSKQYCFICDSVILDANERYSPGTV